MTSDHQQTVTLSKQFGFSWYRTTKIEYRNKLNSKAHFTLQT